MLSAKESNDMNDAKEIHTCLKQASGVFEFTRENLTHLLLQPVSDEATPYTDVDARVLSSGGTRRYNLSFCIVFTE